MVHFALAALMVAPPGTTDLARHVLPLGPQVAAPKIVVDLGPAEDLRPWSEKARALAVNWWPHITQILATEGWTPPTEVRFVFRENQDAPAFATGGEISFSVDWLRRRPDDFGMVIHELTHIIQAYPRNQHDTGWLVEGIADYVRWWRYEPEAPRTPIDFARASHKDGYRTTAHWLAWVAQRHDMRLIRQLDAALRKAEDPVPVFQRVTGKTPEALWADFRTALGS